MRTRLCDDGIFHRVDPPCLAGSRCGECRTVVFPRQRSCPRCWSGAMLDHRLAERGTIWSWTVQEFEPKPPYRAPRGGFQPYAVGYVHLGEVIVESVLLVDRADLRIGLPVRLTTWTCFTDGETAVLSYAFEPAREARP